jgi:hypothetical protein
VPVVSRPASNTASTDSENPSQVGPARSAASSNQLPKAAVMTLLLRAVSRGGTIGRRAVLQPWSDAPAASRPAFEAAPADEKGARGAAFPFPALPYIVDLAGAATKLVSRAISRAALVVVPLQASAMECGPRNQRADSSEPGSSRSGEVERHSEVASESGGFCEVARHGIVHATPCDLIEAGLN